MRVLAQENRIFMENGKSDDFWFMRGIMGDSLTLKKYLKLHPGKNFSYFCEMTYL